MDPILIQITVNVPHDAPAPTVDDILEAAGPLKALVPDHNSQVLVSVSRLPMPYPISDPAV